MKVEKLFPSPDPSRGLVTRPRPPGDTCTQSQQKEHTSSKTSRFEERGTLRVRCRSGSGRSRSASEDSRSKRNIQARKCPGSRSEASLDAEADRAGAVPHLTRSGSTPRLAGVVCWFCRHCLRMLHSSIERRCMWVLPPLPALAAQVQVSTRQASQPHRINPVSGFARLKSGLLRNGFARLKSGLLDSCAMNK
jgi:hypothetical protein